MAKKEEVIMPLPINHHIKWASGIPYSEWVRRVEEITDELVRAKAAGIVWYDLLSERKGGHPHGLEKYVGARQANPVEPSRICEGLIQVGYPKEVAERRSVPATGTSVVPFSQSGITPQEASGAEAMMYAVCALAVEDVKVLTGSKVIRHGKVRKNWPPKDGSTG